jgi:methylated-DNA-[protein]-cysteine S-methyltransferase
VAEDTLLTDETESPRLETRLFKPLQERICAYFEGENVDFSSDSAVCISSVGSFGRQVLEACRGIKFGETLTYAALADKLGRRRAARAVGNALAANPLPLIVPCHRVLRADGRVGGFTAPGGTAMKKRLLIHERAAGPLCIDQQAEIRLLPTGAME